ncbi:hypothetical protein F5X96DRAFT_641717 [Biscogniauxia mediterranea]|nr:hypothetical protein F5X96DRAFT_641717 [Biscogniauxia mediterranea]
MSVCPALVAMVVAFFTCTLLPLLPLLNSLSLSLPLSRGHNENIFPIPIPIAVLFPLLLHVIITIADVDEAFFLRLVIASRGTAAAQRFLRRPRPVREASAAVTVAVAVGKVPRLDLRSPTAATTTTGARCGDGGDGGDNKGPAMTTTTTAANITGGLLVTGLSAG